jgi:hypothetical protein
LEIRTRWRVLFEIDFLTFMNHVDIGIGRA